MSTPAGRPSLPTTGTRIRAVKSPSPRRAWRGTFLRAMTGLVASTASTRVAISTNASTGPMGMANAKGTSVGEVGQLVEGGNHVADHGGRHPRTEQRQRSRDHQDLG